MVHMCEEKRHFLHHIQNLITLTFLQCTQCRNWKDLHRSRVGLCVGKVVGNLEVPLTEQQLMMLT